MKDGGYEHNESKEMEIFPDDDVGYVLYHNSSGLKQPHCRNGNQQYHHPVCTQAQPPIRRTHKIEYPNK